VKKDVKKPVSKKTDGKKSGETKDSEIISEKTKPSSGA